MRIRLTCMKCAVGTPRQAKDMFVEIGNDGLYDVICSNGHRSQIFLQNEKFDILFELGVNALLDGYSREAVASMAASLERFLERYVEIISLKNGIPSEMFKETWKQLAKQSERQLGAFLMVYLLEKNKPPSYLSQAQIQFRNDVIHRGVFPSREQVMQYGQEVLNLITAILLDLLEQDSALPFLASLEDSNHLFKDSDERAGTYLPTTIYQWLLDNHQKALHARLERTKSTAISFERQIDLQSVVDTQQKRGFMRP